MKSPMLIVVRYLAFGCMCLIGQSLSAQEKSLPDTSKKSGDYEMGSCHFRFKNLLGGNFDTYASGPARGLYSRLKPTGSESQIVDISFELVCANAKDQDEISRWLGGNAHQRTMVTLRF